MKTLQHHIKVKEQVSIPVFKEFSENSEKKIKFLVCPFHDQYNGLIGNDILKEFKIIVNLRDNFLDIDGRHIPIKYNNDGTEFYFEKRGLHEVSLPVEQKEGLIYNPQTILENEKIEIIEGIYEANDSKIQALVNVSGNLPKRVVLKSQDTIEVNTENFYINTIQENEEKIPLIDQIRIEHLNTEEKEKLLPIIKRYKKIFYTEDNDLSFTNAIKHEIRTKTNIPIAAKTYRYPYIHKEEVNKQIKEMLDKKIIRQSYSPYSAPVWIVPKKMDASGKKKWRLVVDYRKLNEETIDDRYPIPNIDEILEKLGRCQYFTTLDLAKGFHQIEISDEDIPKTAFSVEGGHYEFLRMPFGLKTAPATFQRLMNNVLSDLINTICLVYLDDIIIFSTSLQEHTESLIKVFQRLKDVNLKIQLDKSEFMKRSTNFLGHVVTNEGIKPNPEKIICVQKFPLPKNQKEIKQFLGLAGYYRKFVKDYSKIARPMTKYLKKDMVMNIRDTEYIESCETLKKLLTNPPILIYPDFNKKFTLQTDASNYALGAVLSQDGHPVSYASRTLNGSEQNYSTIEKELLAIVWATKHFRPYLFGRKFLIETDHRPLAWLFSIKEPNSKLVRWRLRLQEYDYEIKYKKGVLNGNADALSRIEIETNEVNIMEINKVITEVDTPVNFFKRQYIIKQTSSGSLKLKTEQLFQNKRKTITAKNFDEETLITLLKTHFDPEKINAVVIESEALFEKFKEIVMKYFSSNNKFKIYRSKKVLQDISDENELTEMIEREHKKNNHRGINENFAELRTKIYHPKLKKRITQFINNCDTCNKEKYERRPIKQIFKITETPQNPGEIVHADVYYSLEKKLFLTFIDKFSKYAQAISIKNRSWVEFKTALAQYLSSVGSIKKLVIDNELGFKALPLLEYLREQEINIHFTSNNNHTSNADVERFHNTLNEHVRILKHDSQKDIETVEEKIFRCVKYYNNTIHSTTQRKPIDFINGTINREDYPNIRDRMIKIKERTIGKINKNREDVEIQTGPIYLKDERGGKNHSKFRKVRVSQVDGDHVITSSGHKYYKSHIKRKKKFQNENNQVPT